MVARIWRIFPAPTFLLIQGLFAGLWATAHAQTASPSVPDPEQIRALEQRLSGVALVGFFTQVDANSKDLPKLTPERYEIRKLSKLPTGNLWQFDARIVYGTFDLTLPMPLPIEWAGETPIIVVKSLFIPGVGQVDARVMIHEDSYSGTWCHGEHHGHMFGRIEKLPAEQAVPDKDRSQE